MSSIPLISSSRLKRRNHAPNAIALDFVDGAVRLSPFFQQNDPSLYLISLINVEGDFRFVILFPF